MPELPEVETIRRGLGEVLPGRTIAQVDVRYSGSIKKPSAGEFMMLLPGRTVTATARRGKYLLLSLDDGSFLVVHLRMTGKLIFTDVPALHDKHTHLIFTFTDKTTLFFNDIRKFGTVYLLPEHRLDEIRGLANLGPEPLSDNFNAAYLENAVKKRKTTIKALLLNQEIVAGLGNIYVDEALHRAGLKPARLATTLESDELACLVIMIKEVLSEAILYRGTTLSDYRDAGGSYGQFQHHLRVYQRRGLACLRCGQIIERSVVAGRGTHFCPTCQI